MLLRTEEENKREIARCLTPLLTGAAGYAGLREDAVAFWKALGYTSERTLEALDAANWGAFEEIIAAAVPGAPVRGETAPAELKARVFDRVGRVVGLFQYDDDAVRAALTGQGDFFSSEGGILPSAIHSYVFLAVELTGAEALTRTDLATLTREVNRLFVMPALLLVRHPERETLTLAVQDRRLSRRAGQEDRDVLGRVTLVKDIALAADGSGGAGESSRSPQPNRAHLEILHDLSFDELRRAHSFANFDGLHEAWRKTLDTSELNRKFYRELANWYFWARERVRFGPDASEAVRSQAVIRLITRLIFVWFLKEKGLVPEALFREETLRGLVVKFADPEASTYYKAILQNLFFATLNAEMDDTQRPRRFVRKPFQGKNPDRGKTDLWRYQDMLTDPDRFETLVARVPFLNGGLFECLDQRDEKGNLLPDGVVDGFTENTGHAKSVVVPNELFFGEERSVDLNAVYDTKDRRYTVRGLIPLLSRYKFTVEENTPVEQEIALDPELLGRVFENLLASYNPETATTARKQTGSFYTPREIVDYMVDEALVAYLGSQVPGVGEEALRRLTGYADADRDASQYLDPEQIKALIKAIDQVKILDPACGSGAFPMGALQKLVHLLKKLDPNNEGWRAVQRARALAETEEAFNLGDQKARQERLKEIEEAFTLNASDYGRKLYLIENSIYGVDIQPIAVQIAKLRFFISLVVDQTVRDEAKNRGIRPLPNLETKFVAANALLGITRPKDVTVSFEDVEVRDIEADLKTARREHFLARDLATKKKWRAKDRELRERMAALLESGKWGGALARRIAEWDPYKPQLRTEDAADFFDPELMFGIPVNPEKGEGFDITLGNPPYVRADSGEKHLAMRRAILDSGMYETLNEKWDLAVPFIERGFKLLRPGGVTTMIVSDGFCHAKYAIRPQTWFLANARILRLDFYSKIKIFEAAVKNVSYLFQREDCAENVPLRRVHDPAFGEVRRLPSGPQKSLTHRVFFPEDTEAATFANPTVPLSDICYISVGMVVNADERSTQGAFDTEDVLSYQKDEKHPKPYVDGRNMERWLMNGNRWLEWGTIRAPSQFRRRTFDELYDRSEKLILPKVGQIRVALDSNKVCFNDSLFACVPYCLLEGVRNNSIKKTARYTGEHPPRPDLPKREDLENTSRQFALKYLLAVLNSTPARDFLRANRRNNVQLYPDDWKKLPVPVATPEQQSEIVKLVDAILAARKNDPAADIAALEQEVDAKVAALYGLEGSEASRPAPPPDEPAASTKPGKVRVKMNL